MADDKKETTESAGKESLGCFNDSVSLEKYLKEKGANHRSYKIYGTEKILRSVFVDKQLYLSDGSNWNDTVDGKEFSAEDGEYKYYARCFTYSTSENVAMWMLYGGITDKKGVMVDMGGAKNLNQIIEKCTKVDLGEFDGNPKKFKKSVTINKDDFELYLIDIVYYGEAISKDEKDNKDKVYLKRSYESAPNAEKTCIDGLKRAIKDIGWSYENECRLILKVKKKLCEGCSVAEINFSKIDLDKKITVITSPNYGEELEFKKSLEKNVSYKESVHKSKISWNLCKGCKYLRFNKYCKKKLIYGYKKSKDYAKKQRFEI